MRSNVCVNEMALFAPFAAFVKGKTFYDSDGEKGGLPTRRDSGPTRYTANIPIDRHGFAESLVSFRTLCGVQSSLVRFAPNRAIAWGSPQWQAPLRLCVSCPRWPELSAHVRRRNSSTSYSQGYCERVASVPRRKRFVVS